MNYLNYSDFKTILITKVFTMSVAWEFDYFKIKRYVLQHSGVDSLTIITVNETEDVIKVSYLGKQEIYSSYESALEGIVTHYDLDKSLNIKEIIDKYNDMMFVKKMNLGA